MGGRVDAQVDGWVQRWMDGKKVACDKEPPWQFTGLLDVPRGSEHWKHTWWWQWVVFQKDLMAQMW